MFQPFLYVSYAHLFMKLLLTEELFRPTQIRTPFKERHTKKMSSARERAPHAGRPASPTVGNTLLAFVT